MLLWGSKRPQKPLSDISNNYLLPCAKFIPPTKGLSVYGYYTTNKMYIANSKQSDISNTALHSTFQVVEWMDFNCIYNHSNMLLKAPKYLCIGICSMITIDGELPIRYASIVTISRWECVVKSSSKHMADKFIKGHI